VAELKRICVVGPGTRFLSGLTYYTYSLIGALDQAGHRTSALLIRSLVPRLLYPGRARVGKELADLSLPTQVRRVDGIDWYWGWSLIRALRLLWKERPEVLVLQWWTGAVLHTYIVLSIAARLLGAEVVIEFHEAQDVGEAKLPFVTPYMNFFGRRLLRLSTAQIAHSQFDIDLIRNRYGLNGSVALVPHAGYDYLPLQRPLRSAPADAINILYFGVIRPFKGVEDLVAAFNELSSAGSWFWLTVVGETWERWDAPSRQIAASPHRDRITFVNRYVTDAEAAGYFAGADLVVLPYHRSSSSGPLQIAMAKGLPVVVAKVGGLVEAAAQYSGAVFVEPSNPKALTDGIVRGTELVGRRFHGVNSWSDTVQAYSYVFDEICR
jgi:glycosyltransferase involved in cell wall biosynthesis